MICVIDVGFPVYRKQSLRIYSKHSLKVILLIDLFELENTSCNFGWIYSNEMGRQLYSILRNQERKRVKQFCSNIFHRITEISV